MDRTKEYILMCEKAVRIQPEELNLGDFYVTKINNDYLHRVGSVQMRRRFYQIRLHRQDQLQGIVKSEPYFAWNHIGQLGRWADKNLFTSSGLNSMEQMWLALVMSEKYNKFWNGEEWIREK